MQGQQISWFQSKSTVVANLEMQSGAFPGMKGIVRSTLLLISSLLGYLLFHLARLKSRFYAGGNSRSDQWLKQGSQFNWFAKTMWEYFFSPAKLGFLDTFHSCRWCWGFSPRVKHTGFASCPACRTWLFSGGFLHRTRQVFKCIFLWQHQTKCDRNH